MDARENRRRINQPHRRNSGNAHRTDSPPPSPPPALRHRTPTASVPGGREKLLRFVKAKKNLDRLYEKEKSLREKRDQSERIMTSYFDELRAINRALQDELASLQSTLNETREATMSLEKEHEKLKVTNRKRALIIGTLIPRARSRYGAMSEELRMVSVIVVQEVVDVEMVVLAKAAGVFGGRVELHPSLGLEHQLDINALVLFHQL